MRAQYLAYIIGVTFGAWAVFPLPPVVLATHENDHRFVVEGHITDSDGIGIPNTKVFIRAEVLETGATAFSNQEGFYSALLHLHNADAGKSITVTALGISKDITADFDPADKDTERKGVVDIVHAAVTAVADGNVESDNSAYLTWGFVALVVGVSFGVFTRKWARRRKTQST